MSTEPLSLLFKYRNDKPGIVGTFYRIGKNDRKYKVADQNAGESAADVLSSNGYALNTAEPSVADVKAGTLTVSVYKVTPTE